MGVHGEPLLFQPTDHVAAGVEFDGADGCKSRYKSVGIEGRANYIENSVGAPIFSNDVHRGVP